MTPASATSGARIETLRAELLVEERRDRAVAFGRLITFVGGVVLLGGGLLGGERWSIAAGLGVLVLFAGLVVVHGGIALRMADGRARLEVHQRHLSRLAGTWLEFPVLGPGRVAPTHDYAWDVDVVGPGSLFQWMDVTHTVPGEQTLLRWLGAPADPATIRERQRAVEELAKNGAFRESLEATFTQREAPGKHDPAPFVTFLRLPPHVLPRPWLLAGAWGLPLVTLGLFGLGQWGLIAPSGFALGLVVQGALALATSGATGRAFDLVAARRGYIEAFTGAFKLLETTTFEAPRLRALQDQLRIEGSLPSEHFRALDRWAGLAELRTQFPVHLVVNTLCLWDLHVLAGLERWNRRGQVGTERLFEILGEMEALASLATLRALDPSTTFPEIVEDAPTFVADGLAHPLLPQQARVANTLPNLEQGSLLIVTGSNMAGKSTLLRAVGLNIALALAGGPVTARQLRVSPVRLRASMRAEDSLQRGASYFHAELLKLKQVVAQADATPPVFFLLDELLRGTNARARHVGARAVVLHLTRRGALGIVATHDVALADLEGERRRTVKNVHFTDVERDGEMTFDYALRDGVVRTSNALRLLERAGIDLPEGLAKDDLHG